MLEPAEENSTRLILRARSGPSPTTWFDILAEPAYFLMTRGMMLGIKRRAEMAALKGCVVSPPVDRARL